MVRGKYLRERKANRQRRRVKLLSLAIIIVVLYKLIFGVFSRYETQANSNADLDVAFFILDDELTDEYDNTETIQVADLLPGENKKVKFSIFNYRNVPTGKTDSDGKAITERKVSEVDMKYYINIRATTNLPLKYTLTYNGLEYKLKKLDQDSDNTYFILLADGSKDVYYNLDSGELIPTGDTSVSADKKINPFNGTFEHDTEMHKDYELNIEFPAGSNSYIYQNIVEAIEISVYAEQVVDE